MPAAGERALQVRRGQLGPERLRAHRRERRPGVELGGRHQVDEAEAARVAQREAMVGGLQHDVIVLAEALGIDPPAAAHTEVEDDGLLAVGMEQAVLGAAAEPDHPRAGEALDESVRKRKAHVRPVERDALEPLAFEIAGEAAHGGFDFGKLGHRGFVRQGACG